MGEKRVETMVAKTAVMTAVKVLMLAARMAVRKVNQKVLKTAGLLASSLVWLRVALLAVK